MTDVSVTRYAVIGHPVAHSRSPWIHARFAEQTGQAIAYEAIDCPPDGFATTLQRLQKARYGGCNVTVPFKHALSPLRPATHRVPCWPKRPTP
jgi:shikimate dehydrogenase (EC 1.1.1.25)